jgi:glycolate oxidase iron-sulfur subunit
MGDAGRTVGPAGTRGGEKGLATALSGQEERLGHCVHCGFCLPVCPTYQELGDEADSPRGRLHLMRAVVEGRLDPGSDAFQRHMDRCLGCRACETVCPSGVAYGHLLEHAREAASAARPPARLTRALLGAVARPSLLRAWMGASRLLRGTGLPRVLARVTPPRAVFRSARLGFAMLAASAPARFDRPGAPVTGTSPGEADGPEPVSAGHGSCAMARGSRGRVAMLEGCVQRHLFSRVNGATRRVLEANGWSVVAVPGQGCCGALHAHAGDLEAARAMARANIARFRTSGVEWIVANAAGCGATMRDYADLLGARDDDAAWFAERVRDVSELVAGDGIEPATGGELRLKVAYDPPCHLLHAQRVTGPPERLLDGIPGLERVPLDDADRCCGGAGIYGITHPDLGGRIGEGKVQAIRASGCDVVATGNPGCAMQIGAGLLMAGSRIRVVHPVELLDESYRRCGLYGGEGT